jgi:hypothetical protein
MAPARVFLFAASGITGALGDAEADTDGEAVVLGETDEVGRGSGCDLAGPPQPASKPASVANRQAATAVDRGCRRMAAPKGDGSGTFAS